LAPDDTSVVVLAAAPTILSASTGASSEFERLANTLDGQEGDARIPLGNGEQAQLRFEAPLSSDCVAVIPLDLDGFGRLEAVHRLLASLHGRVIPPDTRLTRQQRLRARRMLQAFDGSRAGASQQDIARVLFRISRLSRDEWQASSIRHAVIALLRDARAMIAGGYRNLLKHRRRP